MTQTSNGLREGLEFPNPTGSGQGNQEQGLLGQIPKRRLLKGLIRRLGQGIQNDVEVPARGGPTTNRIPQRKGPHQVPQDRRSRDLRQFQLKNCSQHRPVPPDTRQRQPPHRMEVEKEVCHLRDRRAGNGTALIPAPATVNVPLRLVESQSGGPSRKGDMASHSRREAGTTRESPDSLHA